jgi:hypothetical protein
MSDFAFDAMYIREIKLSESEHAVQKIHDLMSTFKITDYEIKLESNRFEVDKSVNPVCPDRELSDLERSFLSTVNAQKQVLTKV